MVKNMKTKILNFLLKLKELIINYSNIAKNKIVVSYGKCKVGEEKMTNLLLYWATVPCLLYLYITCKFSFPFIIASILNIFMLLFTILNFYFIQKAVKVHPEYNTELIEELKKAEYYSTLDEKELKKVKKSESLNKKKNIFKGIFNLGTKKKVDFYKIIRALVILTFLIAFKRLVI